MSKHINAIVVSLLHNGLSPCLPSLRNSCHVPCCTVGTLSTIMYCTNHHCLLVRPSGCLLTHCAMIYEQ